MTRSLLNLLLKFAKPAQVSRQLMKNTTKNSLLTKSAMERFKVNSIRNAEITNPTISKEYFQKWVKDAKAGLTVPPPTNSYELYNKIPNAKIRKIKDYFNSSKFPLEYRNQMNKSINEVPINFLPKKSMRTKSFRNNLGVYTRAIQLPHRTTPNMPKISIQNRRPLFSFNPMRLNAKGQLSTGVHELKHAAQYGNNLMPGLRFPSKAITEIIDKNMIRMPRFASKKLKDYIKYLRKPQEVSARLEEIRAMRKTGSILERWRINNSDPMQALKRVFGSVKKVLEMEKQIWGLAPIGAAGLLNNFKEN